MAIAWSRISSKVIANPPSTPEACRRWFGRLQMPSGRMCTANGRQRKAESAGSAVRRGDPACSSVSPPEARSHSCDASSGCQRLDDIAGRDQLCLAWKEALGQEVVNVSILIGAAILHDDQTVVQIRSGAYRREHHTAGGIPENDQGVARIGA